MDGVLWHSGHYSSLLLPGVQADGCVVGFVFNCRLIILFYGAVFHYLDTVFGFFIFCVVL